MVAIPSKKMKQVPKKQVPTQKKRNPKRKLSEEVKVENVEPVPAPVRFSDEPPPKKPRWINRQRVLVFAARGITFRYRHLLEDLRKMLPHARPDSKMEKKDNMAVINEICEMKNCNKCIFFECRKKQDLYMWIANIPKGPSVKFLVQNVYTQGELKLTGNCLKGSRPLLSFDKHFDALPHYQLLKELFVQVFGTPNYHPKSQPFFDHVLTFSVVDHRIWFRNYQIVTEDASLAEVGPRFVLSPVKIFDGSFGGSVLWENPHYVSPNSYRLQMKQRQGSRYEQRRSAKLAYAMSRPEKSYEEKPFDDIFQCDALEKALAEEKNGNTAEESEIVTLPGSAGHKSRGKRNKKSKKQQAI